MKKVGASQFLRWLNKDVGIQRILRSEGFLASFAIWFIGLLFFIITFMTTRLQGLPLTNLSLVVSLFALIGALPFSASLTKTYMYYVVDEELKQLHESSLKVGNVNE